MTCTTIVDQCDLIQSKWFKYLIIVRLVVWKKVDANRSIVSIQACRQNSTVNGSNSKVCLLHALLAKQRPRTSSMYTAQRRHSVLYIPQIEIRSFWAMWHMNFICSLENDREYAQGIQMTCWWIIIWWMIFMDVNNKLFYAFGCSSISYVYSYITVNVPKKKWLR